MGSPPGSQDPASWWEWGEGLSCPRGRPVLLVPAVFSNPGESLSHTLSLSLSLFFLNRMSLFTVFYKIKSDLVFPELFPLARIGCAGYTAETQCPPGFHADRRRDSEAAVSKCVLVRSPWCHHACQPLTPLPSQEVTGGGGGCVRYPPGPNRTATVSVAWDASCVARPGLFLSLSLSGTLP